MERNIKVKMFEEDEGDRRFYKVEDDGVVYWIADFNREIGYDSIFKGHDTGYDILEESYFVYSDDLMFRHFMPDGSVMDGYQWRTVYEDELENWIGWDALSDAQPEETVEFYRREVHEQE